MITHQKGSHVKLRRGATVVVIPMHNPLKIGTLRNILRQVGMTPEELIDLL